MGSSYEKRHNKQGITTSIFYIKYFNPSSLGLYALSLEYCLKLRPDAFRHSLPLRNHDMLELPGKETTGQTMWL